MTSVFNGIFVIKHTLRDSSAVNFEFTLLFFFSFFFLCSSIHSFFFPSLFAFLISVRSFLLLLFLPFPLSHLNSFFLSFFFFLFPCSSLLFSSSMLFLFIFPLFFSQTNGNIQNTQKPPT